MTVPEPGASTKRQGQRETIPAGGGFSYSGMEACPTRMPAERWAVHLRRTSARRARPQYACGVADSKIGVTTSLRVYHAMHG
jgi:hypothetical protein